MTLVLADSFFNTAASTFVTASISGFSNGDTAIILAYGFESTSGNTFIITDPLAPTNTYTKRAESTQNATFRSSCAIFDCTFVTAPASISISYNGLPSTAYSIVVLRVTGLTASPFDQQNSGTVTGDDPAAPSVTTTTADEIVVIGLTHDGADTTFDAPTDYTMARELESNVDCCYASAYRVVSATGTFAPNWATGASRDYGLVTAAYKGTPSGTQNQLAWIRA